MRMVKHWNRFSAEVVDFCFHQLNILLISKISKTIIIVLMMLCFELPVVSQERGNTKLIATLSQSYFLWINHSFVKL